MSELGRCAEMVVVSQLDLPAWEGRACAHVLGDHPSDTLGGPGTKRGAGAAAGEPAA